MPRATNQPAEPTAPAPDGAADFLSAAIENAKALIEVKRSIQADLQSARDFLNHAVKIGATSDEQTAWILENLPKRTRKGKGEEEEESGEDTAGTGAAA